MNIIRFNSRKAMLLWVVNEIVEILMDGIEQRGKAVFVASGGTTPSPIYEALSKADIPWECVTVTLSDERWVDLSSIMSNQRSIQLSLLKNNARKARFIGLKTKNKDAPQGIIKMEDEISLLQPFDVGLLGMGLDGHTASLFPKGDGAIAALQSKKTLAAISPSPLPPAAPYSRISLTLSALAGIRRVLLLAPDNQKLSILEQGRGDEAIALPPVISLARKMGDRITAVWAPTEAMQSYSI